MSSPLANSFDGLGGDSLPTAADDEFSIESPIFSATSYPHPIDVSGGGFSADPAELSPEPKGQPFEGGRVAENGPILPPPVEMGRDEGIALREWRRENAIRLEEKERREKELMSQIIAEAEDYKVDFHTKRKVNCATNKVTNREREKILVSSLEKVHAEADKNYWKTIAELIPNEIPAIENKREKAGERKKPSISVIQGPKPGKPTELSRMRHILLKLKHETPSHLKILPIKDAKIDALAATSVEAVAAA